VSISAALLQAERQEVEKKKTRTKKKWKTRKKSEKIEIY
jgi:hypothetical protein